MKGYKVVSEDHIHHGFKYQKGLNVDTRRFKSEGSCAPGGLYFFTDIKNATTWIDYGVYLYEVEVPKRREYVKDPEGNKYRASGLILSNPLDLREISTWEYLFEKGVTKHVLVLSWACKKGCYDVVKFLVEKGVDIHADNGYALRLAAENGHIDIIKFLVENGADIHACKDFALRLAAYHGHLEVVEYLVEKGADIQALVGAALRLAADSGHLEVVKYLIEQGVDIHACSDEALRLAAYYGHLEVVEYLKSVGANYEGI